MRIPWHRITEDQRQILAEQQHKAAMFPVEAWAGFVYAAVTETGIEWVELRDLLDPYAEAYIREHYPKGAQPA